MSCEEAPRERQASGPRSVTWSYEIRIQGELDPTWSEWLGGLDVRPTPNGQTLVSGPIVDQAALHGLLERIRDLGLELLSVNRLDGAAPPRRRGRSRRKSA